MLLTRLTFVVLAIIALNVSCKPTRRISQMSDDDRSRIALARTVRARAASLPQEALSRPRPLLIEATHEEKAEAGRPTNLKATYLARLLENGVCVVESVSRAELDVSATGLLKNRYVCACPNGELRFLTADDLRRDWQ